MTRFPLEKYASLELNQVAFPKTGMVVSQTPLGSAFNASAPCENGMWVVADKSLGVMKAPAAATDKPIGIVYTTEKEYDSHNIGLKQHYAVEGDYPRVGILGLGDTVTTNCFQYNESTYATLTALETALNAVDATHPMYVYAIANSPVPAIATSLPSNYNGIYGKVTKYYTVPNGEKAIKYEIVNI